MPGEKLTVEEASELLLAHLDLIQATVRPLWINRGLRESSREDFESDLKLALIEDDYAIVRSFRGESEFSTFLVSFIRHRFHSHCRRLWGEWRPSRTAERHGVLGIRLEMLVHRDGWTLEQAFRTLTISYDHDLTRPELLELWRELPHRTPLGRPEELPLSTRHHPGRSSAIETVATRDELVALLRKGLQEILRELDAEQRMMLRLRFEDALSVPAIADVLEDDKFRLYRRLKNLFDRLRTELQESGIGADEVDELLRSPIVFGGGLDFTAATEETMERDEPARSETP